ncbi:hypothetical protein F1559_002044 [Cyanidiococcus yangmingshanensis]|uniref:CID domain-containing protein n=1 Tax=Cyanidiococcus yangmingshanensis TaxID=2690220 RepID=A0A7J7IM53_9RHOD|nr:hypothetical protein F1559_002044 [Cyanidiococcus yangmingshanensis]
MAPVGDRGVALQYSRANFQRRLSTIQPNLESIQSLSYFILFMAPTFASSLVHDWGLVLAESERERRLHLLYLANEVLQHARNRLPDALAQRLANLFLEGMEQHLALLAGDERLDRLIEVWHQRQVFTDEQLDRLRELINHQREWRARVEDAAQHIASAIARLGEADMSTVAVTATAEITSLVNKLREAQHLVQRYLCDRNGNESEEPQIPDAEVASSNAVAAPPTTSTGTAAASSLSSS